MTMEEWRVWLSWKNGIRRLGEITSSKNRIKAWLLYENDTKVLGSSNHLLSIYGLEVMVLFIINKYHIEIDSPIKCLRRVLRHFSTFDWSKHLLTVSKWGTAYRIRNTSGVRDG